jgi:TolA-binding protein
LREVSFTDSADCLIFEFSQEELQDELERLKDEIMQLREQVEEVERLRKELEEQQAQNTKQNKESKLKRLKDTVNQGKVSPAEFALLLPFATALLESETMLTFAANPEPVHPVDALIDVLEARTIHPIFKNFSDFMTPGHITESGDGKEDPKARKITNPAYII